MESITVIAAEFDRRAERIEELINENDALRSVVRRLRTGWEPDIPVLGPEVWCWFHPDHDDPEPLSAVEVAVIEATKEVEQ